VASLPAKKPQQMPNTMFPIFLKMDQIQTLVVGGGNVALEKASAILRNSPEAKLTLVAPFFRPDTIEYLQDFPQVRILTRGFQPSDLEGLDLIICATDSPALHAEIKALAVAQHLLCNVADTPPLCDFYLGSIVQKGDLKIAISTNGKSPTLAKRIRAFLEDVIPEDIQTSLDQLEEARKTLKGDFQQKITQLNELTENLVFKKKD
jgi:siroheme synthase-like protein